MATTRMHRGLVALSSSAIAAIYMAGFLRTQSADATLGAAAAVPSQAAPVALAAPAPPGAPTLVATPATTARPTSVALPAPPGAPTPVATPGPTSPPAAQRGIPLAPRTQPATQPTAPPPASSIGAGSAVAGAGLKDGTYTGQGSSRRGDVWVSVQVQSGRIANVSITRSTLQYPLRDIAGLPAQVVQRQSAQVDIVSRATFSSQAFRGAVAQALSKAA